MNLEPRERRMLMVLLGLVMFAGWVYVRPWLLDWLRQSMAGASGRRAQVESLIPRESLVELRAATLNSSPSEYTPGRNIFDFGKPPKRERPVRKDPPRPRPEPKPEKRELKPDPGPRPPVVDFTLMGVFGPDHRRIAVLNDQDSIINALQSQTLRDEFVVVDIDYLWIDVGFVNFPDEPPVRLEIER